MPQAPASRAATTTRSIWRGWSERPGRRGAIPTDARTPASTSTRSARSRWPGMSGAGLGRAPDLVVERRHRERHRHLCAARGLGEQLCVTDDQRPTGDDRERLRGIAQHLDARPRQPVAPLGRLVRVGGSTDRDRAAVPRTPRELRAQLLGDVHLDADRRPVALVRRPVGPQLEGPHVTERAAVHTAHVRVQGPVEGHALDVIEGDLAWLLAVLRPHVRDYRTYVRVDQAVAILGRLIRLDDDLPPSTRAPESGAEVI